MLKNKQKKQHPRVTWNHLNTVISIFCFHNDVCKFINHTFLFLPTVLVNFHCNKFLNHFINNISRSENTLKISVLLEEKGPSEQHMKNIGPQHSNLQTVPIDMRRSIKHDWDVRIFILHRKDNLLVAGRLTSHCTNFIITCIQEHKNTFTHWLLGLLWLRGRIIRR